MVPKHPISADSDLHPNATTNFSDMSRSTVYIAIGLVLGLSVQASYAQCGTADATKPDPPSGSVVYATFDAVGVRIFQCSAGNVVNPTKVNAQANLTGTSYKGTWNGESWSGDSQPNGWTGNFVYVNDVAKFTVVNSASSTPTTYVFNLDNKPVIDPNTPTGALGVARWTVTWVGEAPPSVANSTAFLIRKDITGGANPNKCPSANVTQVEVPYTAKYDLRVCTTKTSAAFVPGVRTALVSLAMAAIAILF